MSQERKKVMIYLRPEAYANEKAASEKIKNIAIWQEPHCWQGLRWEKSIAGFQDYWLPC